MWNSALKLVSCVTVALSASFSLAQTQSKELLGTVTANQVSNGLGFNLDPNKDWQWAAAAAAGATHARIDCQWSTVEQQTAPPLNKQAAIPYIQDPACVAGFASAVKYGIHPTVVAAFGAPSHQILTVIVPNGAPVGATTVDIELKSGVGGDTLSNVAYPYDYFKGPASVTANSWGKLSQFGSYEGTFITGIKITDPRHATLSLASALIVQLPADGTEYAINEILHPSALTTSPTDPSVVAYGNYVSFLAQDMASRGVTGDIEIWNEPPWLADPWDDRGYLYDVKLWPGPQSPGPVSRIAVNWGFIGNLQNKTFPAGITATWNGTSGGGTASLLGTGMFQNSGVYYNQTSTVVTKESFHPYGNTPEEANWMTSCVDAAAAATTYPGNNVYNCLLSGEHNTNFVYAAYLDAKAKLADPTHGIAHSVTETGTAATVPGLRIPQARFVIRQYLAYQADGVTPIEFYKLFDETNLQDPNYSFVEEVGASGRYTANPQYTTIAGFMSDLKPISNLPVTPYSASTLPSVVSYSGTFPLASVQMVGSRDGSSQNSDMFAVWQRSYTPCATPGNNCGDATTWMLQPSPAPAPVTVSIPSGMSLTQLINATTREAVAYTSSGQQITFQVADDPIEILVDPSSLGISSTPAKPTTVALTQSASANTYGTQVVLTATLSPFSTKQKSTNGETITFFNGTSLLGTGTLSSGVATLNVTSLPVGNNSIIAQYGGDASFMASVGSQTATVIPAMPSLTFNPVSDQTYGSAPFLVSATSPSSAYISYSVVSGPARISASSAHNATITLLGAGTIVLQASQPASSNYLAATVRTTFVSKQKSSNLAFGTVSTKTFGNDPFGVVARSNSSGAITYSVVSGPANISGNTVTLTAIGTVVLEADQAAAGNYAANTVRTSFDVQGGNGIAFDYIPDQVYGTAPFAVKTNTPSPGAITYSVVSGPASFSGNIITLSGAGEVVLKVSQAAVGRYGASTAQTSFKVTASGSLTFQSIPNKTYGTVPFSVSANSPSPGAITYTVVSGPATISGTTVTLTGAGTVLLKASQASAAGYAASTAQTSFSVGVATANLTFSNITNQTYGAAPFMVSASSDSASPITFSVASGPSTINGHTVTITGIGTVVITANQPAAGNYAAATSQTSFTVAPEVPSLSFSPISPQTYGASPFAISATSPSTGAITYSIVSGPASLTGSTITLSGTGVVTLTATQAAAGNYASANVQTAFVVNPAIPLLTFNTMANQVYGVAPFAVSANSVSSGAITYTVVSGPANISGNTVTLTGAGSVVLKASQAAAGNYAGATAQASFMVSAATANLTFNPISNQTYGAVWTLNAHASSASPGTITYSVVSGPTRISHDTVYITGVGTTVLQANQAASGSYPAASAQISFSISPGALTLVPVLPQVYGGPSVTVHPISASPGKVTCVVVSGPATISGSKVTTTGTGTVVIGATQAASGNYPGGQTQLSFAVSSKPN